MHTPIPAPTRWPVVVAVTACAVYTVYGVVVLTRLLADRPIPPPTVNSLIIATTILAVMVSYAVDRVRTQEELAAIRRELAELGERTPVPNGRVPERVYVAAARVRRDEDETTERGVPGLGPVEIQALRRVNQRLNHSADDGP